jgi:membrane-associated protease RseP (regulator of RpoE activity)
VYWDSYLDQFFIDPSGIAKSRASSMALMHLKKMTVLSPDPKGTAVVADKRPTLVWQPLPGASSYQVYWLVEPAPHVVASQVHEHTTATRFQMTEDAIPDRRYEWGVMAFGPDGRQLGYWSAAYFYTPGGKEAFAKIPEMTSPKKGTPYLGIVPLRPGGMPGHELGILVRSISAGSPALAAGLQPDDILTSFNGKPLAQATVVDFVNLVRAQTAGSVVALEYMRQGVKKSTKITVGTMP